MGVLWQILEVEQELFLIFKRKFSGVARHSLLLFSPKAFDYRYYPSAPELASFRTSTPSLAELKRVAELRPLNPRLILSDTKER